MTGHHYWAYPDAFLFSWEMPLGEHADRLTILFPFVKCSGDLEDCQSHSLKSAYFYLFETTSED